MDGAPWNGALDLSTAPHSRLFEVGWLGPTSTLDDYIVFHLCWIVSCSPESGVPIATATFACPVRMDADVPNALRVLLLFGNITTDVARIIGSPGLAIHLWDLDDLESSKLFSTLSAVSLCIQQGNRTSVPDNARELYLFVWNSTDAMHSVQRLRSYLSLNLGEPAHIRAPVEDVNTFGRSLFGIAWPSVLGQGVGAVHSALASDVAMWTPRSRMSVCSWADTGISCVNVSHISVGLSFAIGLECRLGGAGEHVNFINESEECILWLVSLILCCRHSPTLRLLRGVGSGLFSRQIFPAALFLLRVLYALPKPFRPWKWL